VNIAVNRVNIAVNRVNIAVTRKNIAINHKNIDVNHKVLLPAAICEIIGIPRVDYRSFFYKN
jgi:hypothetical protein